MQHLPTWTDLTALMCCWYRHFSEKTVVSSCLVLAYVHLLFCGDAHFWSIYNTSKRSPWCQGELWSQMLAALLNSMKPNAWAERRQKWLWAEAEAQVKFLPKEPTMFRAWSKASRNQPASLFDAVIICSSTGSPVLIQGTGRKRLPVPIPSLCLIYADAKVCSLRTFQI